MPVMAFFLFGIILPLAFPSGVIGAQGVPAFSDFEYQVTDDGAFGLYKPKGWRVGTQKYPNGRMVFLTDPKDQAGVSLVFLEKIDPQHDSVTFAGATLKMVAQQLPTLKILEARSSSDRMKTVVKFQRRGPQEILIEGRNCFQVKHPTATVIGYEAPAQQFRGMTPTLITIVANITILDEEAYRQITSRGKAERSGVLPMKKVTALDGTCRMLAPEGWNLTAAQGTALCASPDGDRGFIFTLIDFVGQSQIPYFSSSQIPGNLRYPYMPPIEALIVAMKHYGSTGQQVLERYPNSALAQQATAALHRRADAESALIASMSKNGVPCIGYYEVLGLHPNYAGQWGIIPMGIWAPKSEFARLLPTLIQMAESYEINQRWASEYVRQGMANLKALMQKTASMMSRYAEEMRQSSLAAHQNRMKSSDFISYKFSTYMRGEQEWVTGLEGGKIYSSDHWGLSSGGKMLIEGPPFNYYHYQGDVRYGHIPVDSSREVFEAVKSK